MFIAVSDSVATHFAPLGLIIQCRLCFYTHIALTGLKGRHKTYPYKKEINSKLPKMLNHEAPPKIRVIPRIPRKSVIQTKDNLN